MDRGIPTEEVLAEMRNSKTPIHYLVGSPRGRLTQLQKAFLTKPWEDVRERAHLPRCFRPAPSSLTRCCSSARSTRTPTDRCRLLSRRADVIPEWKTLLRDLDRLQHVRIRHRDNDWLVRTDVSKSIADLFHHAHIALPPRARQMAAAKTCPTQNIRPETPRSSQTWCHVVTNFAESSVISIDYRNQVFK